MMGKSQIPLLLFFGIIYTVSGQDLWSNVISRVPEGTPGVDYPQYTIVPKRTAFNCRDRKPGFYADPETRCQAWHWCDTFLIRHSFLCPNLTVFNQRIRGCDWWYNVDCNLAVSLYVNNDELYRPSPAEEARQAKKVTHRPSPGSQDTELGSSASVPGFTVVNSAREPDVLDYEDSVFSATSAPTTEISFSTSSFASTSPIVTSNPSTRGILRVRPISRVPQVVNNGFQPTIANAIPIAFPPPRAAGPASSTDFDFDATLAAVTGDNTFNTLPHFTATSSANTGSHSTASPTGNVSPIQTARRRPLRFRTHPAVATFVPSTVPSIPPFSPTTSTSSFAFQPAVANTFVANSPTQSDVTFGSSDISQPIHETTDFRETTLDESKRLNTLSPASSQGNDVFLDPVDVPTTSAIQDIFADTEPPFSSVRTTTTTVGVVPTRPFSSFAPFPSRTTQRIASYRPTFQQQRSTTPSLLVTAAGATTLISERRPSQAFSFGIPFGARIAPGINVDNSATVRRSDDFIETPTTIAARPTTNNVLVNSTANESLRHRKFITPTKSNTFPPFPITTFSPKLSTAPFFQEASITSKESTLATPKPTKPVKSSTAEAASTTQRRTFPSFPITTFKPSTVALLTRAAIDGTFGERDTEDTNAVTEKSSKFTTSPSVSLQEGFPISR